MFSLWRKIHKFTLWELLANKQLSAGNIIVEFVAGYLTINALLMFQEHDLVTKRRSESAILVKV